MKKLIIMIALLGVGCSYISSKFPQSKQLPRQQTCTELKQQLVFNKDSNGQELDATRQAERDKLYRKYKCQ